jgi:hypothetical protein
MVIPRRRHKVHRHQWGRIYWVPYRQKSGTKQQRSYCPLYKRFLGKLEKIELFLKKDTVTLCRVVSQTSPCRKNFWVLTDLSRGGNCNENEEVLKAGGNKWNFLIYRPGMSGVNSTRRFLVSCQEIRGGFLFTLIYIKSKNTNVIL